MPSALDVPPVGAIMPYAFDGDPPGGTWVLADGRLIPSANYPVFDAGAGSTGGHKYNGGVSPGAGKVRIPDKRGRVSVGTDNMLGTRATDPSTGSAYANPGAASRLGTANRTIGLNGGADRVTLASTESGMPAHTHSASSGTDSVDHVHTFQNWGSNAAVDPGVTFALLTIFNNINTLGVNQFHTHPITVNNATAVAAAASHQNLQPYEVDNWIVRIA